MATELEHVAVPEFIEEFYRLFRHVLPRAEADHVDGGGFCQSCIRPWPCDISVWVHELSSRSSLTSRVG